MELWLGADRAGVQVAGHEFGHATHRVVDPADPPRDLSGWAWGVYVSLGLMALLSVLRLASAMSLRSTVTDGGDIIAKYDVYSRWVGFQAVLLLIAAGVFITWFFQAYKNMRRLGVQEMRYGNGWAVGSWFVPILSLVRPKQMANDIWRGSERGTDINSGWKSVPVPALVHWWWALFLIRAWSSITGRPRSSPASTTSSPSTNSATASHRSRTGRRRRSSATSPRSSAWCWRSSSSRG